MEHGNVSSFTIFFEDPFWVGVYERKSEGLLEASRVIFGAEPREPEVYQWLLREWRNLKFSPPVDAGPVRPEHQNPKRRQREARSIPKGVGTKSQQALQLQREQSKSEHQARRREKDADEEARKFQMRQQKKREKHRGH